LGRSRTRRISPTPGLLGFRRELIPRLRALAQFTLCRPLPAGSLSRVSTYSDGSSTICAKITARAAASGRRAHHRCSVLGCPCRIDFSRADALLIASSGSATSMSFLRVKVTSILVTQELEGAGPPGTRVGIIVELGL
jgi:hypothetical protein